MHTMVRNLRVLLGARDEQGPGERELLAAFLSRRDAASLEDLIRRHGPMVLGVCGRSLGDRADTDDAFLAAFVALARRVETVGPSERLACWLHGVAGQAARLARPGAETVVYTRREVTTENLWMRLAPLLDEEVAALPWKQRAAVILCDLEGRTRKEAAGLLGWAEKGTAERLADGRARLASGLRRHGVDVTTGDLAVALAQNVAWGVSATCVRQTAAAALGAPPEAVARLADAAVGAMRPRRLPWWALAAGVGVAIAGVGLALLLAPRPVPVGDDTCPPIAVAPTVTPMSHPGLTRLAAGGAHVASAGGGEVRLWDAVTGKELRRLTGLKGTIISLQFLPGGEALLIADEAAVRLWDAAGDRELARLAPGEADVFAASPDGSRWARGGRSGMVHVWDLQKGKAVKSFQGPSYIVLDLAFGPDGRALAVTGGDNSSALFEAATGKHLLPSHDHKAVQTRVAVSPTGAVIASGGHGGVTLREASSGRVLQRLDLPGAVLAISFADDGRSLLACDDAGRVHAWDVATGRERRRASLGEAGRPVAFSRDGRHVAWATGEALRTKSLDQ
jgi:DNA-directed RNA polymerase specialized sigma24 family protein